MTAFTAESAAALPGPSWLRRARQAAADRFQAQPLPTEALEEWRYSRIDALDLDRFQPPGPPDGPPAEGDGRAFTRELVAAVGRPSLLVETHNGYLAQSHGTDRAVTLERLSAPDAKPVELGHIAGEPDPFAALNLAWAPAPLRVRIGRQAGGGTVVVVHWIDADGAALFTRLLVEVETGASGSVLELVAGPGASLVVPVTELDVADSARLHYAGVQDLGLDAWQIALQASRVGRDSTLVSAAAALGGSYARVRTDSALVSPGGDTRLLALYFGAGQQMHDFRTVQHHHAPKTRSDLLYKGVVGNLARSVYTGLIRVEKGARGANAFQTNRNLVLHEGAHADSVPNLEIEDNDVRCSHASAVGPIAEDQRFYLESRGVRPDVADRLIALGFLSDVLEQIPVPGIGDPLHVQLAAKLVEAERVEAERVEVGSA